MTVPLIDLEIGFTGTAKGMSVAQEEVLDFLFLGLSKIARIIFHHGDCIGSDEQAHRLARKHGFYIVIHPPINDSKRSFCEGDEILKEKDYIPRNHDIVEAVVQMIATPGEYTEKIRSGTWATVRYSTKKQRPVHLVWPDGSLSLDGALVLAG